MQVAVTEYLEIELDKERYPVSFHHDKGFLHIQTTF